MSQPKINRHASLMLFTEKIRANNLKHDKETYAMRIRGNERVIMKRLLHDYINAHNRGKVHSFSEYDSGKVKLPAIIQMGGKKWLMTSNSLMASYEDVSCVADTVASWVLRWKQEIEKGEAGQDLRKIDFIEGIRYCSNDVAILLNTAFFKFEDVPITHPHKPPDTQGKADIEGRSLSKSDLLNFQRKFNNKHAR